MRIYDDKKQNINIKYLKRKFLIKKRFVFSFLIVTATGTLLFLPLGVLKSNSPSIRKVGNFFVKGIEKINKERGLLAKDILSLSDNLFGIAQRYLISFSKNPKELRINLSFKNINRLTQLRNDAIKYGMLVRSENDKVGNYIF